MVEESSAGTALVDPAKQGTALTDPAKQGTALVDPAKQGASLVDPAQQGTALLERAEQAHRGGRFAEVRTLLKELASSGTLTAKEQQRAQALRARLRPDPLVAVLILTCLIMFVSVVISTWR